MYLGRPDLSIMQERLKTALANRSVYKLVFEDLGHTFRSLHLDEVVVDETVDLILFRLASVTDIINTEHTIHSELYSLKVNETPIASVIESKMRDRANLIFKQVSSFFARGEETVDWGCGDGRVTALLYDRMGVRAEGYDVRYYPAPGAASFVSQFDGSYISVSNGFFKAGLMTNVAHHEANNAKILRELARIICTGGRLVVIETVPIKDDPVEFERTFINDYVYNRIFRNAYVPVPGTYETEAGWVKRFAEVGFDLEQLDGIANPLPLGYDQPTIRDWHTRLVFRRNASNRL